MSRRKKFDARCTHCRMRNEICICADIEKCREALSTLKTSVLVLMHNRERNSTTNTGRLAALTVPESVILYRGAKDAAELSPQDLKDPERESWLLFPDESSEVLRPEMLRMARKPLQLILPDGSWRQASKMAKREPLLRSLKKVKLPDLGASTYMLRREPKVGGLATYEALARALGILEGDQYQREMDTLFKTLVTRTLRSRMGMLVKS